MVQLQPHQVGLELSMAQTQLLTAPFIIIIIIISCLHHLHHLLGLCTRQ